VLPYRSRRLRRRRLWLVYLTAIGFIVGSAVFLVAMIKERAVAGQLKAAGTDSLTGVANRGALMRAAGLAMAASQADGRPMAVALLDLDRFKGINDTYGHRAGDLVLQRFAECARKNLRASDIVGRIGGEEFAAVLPGIGADAAALLVDRLRAAFAGDATWIDGTRIEATVSGGIAEYRPLEDPASLDQLFHRADRALYAAKAAGRNRVEIDGDYAAAAMAPDIAHSAA
jgi:diguanylate cyclase (GGDEF)-like protein